MTILQVFVLAFERTPRYSCSQFGRDQPNESQTHKVSGSGDETLPSETESKKIRITDFIYFSDYFTAFMRERRSVGSRTTYRSLSKALGLGSTSNLAMIAIGRRHPNRELLDSLCLQLGLSPEEMEYARFMIAYEKAKNSDEKQLFWERLSGLRPTDDEEIDLDRLAIISQWEYLLLICLAGEKKHSLPSRGAQPSPQVSHLGQRS